MKENSPLDGVGGTVEKVFAGDDGTAPRGVFSSKMAKNNGLKSICCNRIMSILSNNNVAM